MLSFAVKMCEKDVFYCALLLKPEINIKNTPNPDKNANFDRVFAKKWSKCGFYG